MKARPRMASEPMTYEGLLAEFKERKVEKLIEHLGQRFTHVVAWRDLLRHVFRPKKEHARYDIVTPTIAKELLEKLAKCDESGAVALDGSSDEAKEKLGKFKEQLKAAAEGEGGDWTEAVNGGCLEIFDQLQSWEKQIEEGKEVRADNIEQMVKYVEQKWVPMPKMSKLATAVLEKAKPLVAAAEKGNRDREQSGVLSEIKFMTGLAEGVVATYGMLGFTVPHFIIQGTATPVEQLESKLKKFEEGLAIDAESELGKEIATAIEKLKGMMPQMQLICKENPREEGKEAVDHKQTIALKATLMAGSACAIKGNKEELVKMIEKAEASLKEDGEASLFEGEEKQKILSKAKCEKGLEVLKEKLKELNEKAEKPEEKPKEKADEGTAKAEA